MINGKADTTKAINILLVSTSATCSVLSTRPGKFGPKSYEMMGHQGRPENGHLQPLESKVDQHTLTHSILQVPECPVPLLGRDILHKLGAALHSGRQAGVWGPHRQGAQDNDTDGWGQTSPDKASPPPWSEAQGRGPGTDGVSCQASPVVVHLKPRHTWPKRKQYPHHQGAVLGTTPVIQDLTD